MASDNVQKIILSDLKKLDKEIDDIYIKTEDIKKADEFKARFNILEEQLLLISDMSDKQNSDRGLTELESKLIQNIGALSAEISDYSNGKMEISQSRKNRNQLTKRLKEIASLISTKNTKELWSELNTVLDKWNQTSHNEIENHFATTEFSQIALKVLEEQAKKGEEINIAETKPFCDEEYLKEAIKDELIQKAKVQQDEIKKENILDLLEELTEGNIYNPSVWKTLTNMENVRIAPLKKDEKEEKEKEETKETALDVVKPKKSWLDKIKGAIGIDKNKQEEYTIYTLANINPVTGEMENVQKVKEDSFSFEMAKYYGRRLVEININNSEIKLVGKGTMTEYELWAGAETPFDRDIYFHSVAVECPNLKKVEFGPAVKSIPPAMFGHGGNLKEVVLGLGIEKIGKYAFYRTGIEKLIIPNSVKFIDEKAFMKCTDLNDLELGNGMMTIEKGAFSDTAIKTIKIPSDVTLRPSAFGKEKYKKRRHWESFIDDRHIIIEERTPEKYLDEGTLREILDLRSCDKMPKITMVEKLSDYKDVEPPQSEMGSIEVKEEPEKNSDELIITSEQIGKATIDTSIDKKQQAEQAEQIVNDARENSNKQIDER